ncbi:MAG TPA: peptidoglycan bridge formation glycyltransferase FemA/FemB family protein [Anaerolineae bacterium]|nr:peptidoglycan bridge formation glycyltransferase FemA/FemB family protein [Anaerolineae bacterium]
MTASPWGHLMQSYEWGDFKVALGWQAVRLGVEQAGRIIAGAQVLFKKIPLTPFTLAYIPKGPVVDLDNETVARSLFQAIHQAARKSHAIFLRIEPNVLDAPQAHARLASYQLRPTAQTNQPRSTIVIALDSQDETTLLSQMRKTTRKVIRRAARQGVTVVSGQASDLGAFYQILAATAALKNIPLHHREFYEQAWKAFAASNAIHLFLAYYQERVVAAKMVTQFKGRSLHLWGGVSLEGRELGASYLIQWESIKWALARGCHTCDLWGIPDEIAAIVRAGGEIPQNITEGLWGVYTFKRGFGGEIECYVGAYDYAYHPLMYILGMKLLRNRAAAETLSISVDNMRTGDAEG